MVIESPIVPAVFAVNTRSLLVPVKLVLSVEAAALAGVADLLNGPIICRPAVRNAKQPIKKRRENVFTTYSPSKKRQWTRFRGSRRVARTSHRAAGTHTRHRA